MGGSRREHFCQWEEPAPLLWDRAEEAWTVTESCEGTCSRVTVLHTMEGSHIQCRLNKTVYSLEQAELPTVTKVKRVAVLEGP